MVFPMISFHKNPLVNIHKGLDLSSKTFRPPLSLKMLPSHEEIDFWKWAEKTKSLGIAWINPDLTIGHCNYQFANIVGRDRYDCTASDVGSIYPPETRQQIEYALKKLMNGEFSEDFQVRQSVLVTPTGRRVYAKVEATLCRDVHSEIHGIIKVIHELPSGNFSKIDQIASELEALKEETSFIRGRGVQVLVSQDNMRDDNSLKADNKSTISNNDSKLLKAMLVTVCVVLVAAIVGFVALVVGGQINFNGGGGININP